MNCLPELCSNGLHTTSQVTFHRSDMHPDLLYQTKDFLCGLDKLCKRHKGYTWHWSILNVGLLNNGHHRVWSSGIPNGVTFCHHSDKPPRNSEHPRTTNHPVGVSIRSSGKYLSERSTS